MASRSGKRLRKGDVQALRHKIRADFERAYDETLLELKKEGKDFWKDWLKDDKSGAMKAINQFMPRTQETEVGENLGKLLRSMQGQPKQVGEVIEHEPTDSIEGFSGADQDGNGEVSQQDAPTYLENRKDAIKR